MGDFMDRSSKREREISMEISSRMRLRLLDFFFQSSLKLGVPPIVKYTALTFFADRFLLSSLNKFMQENDMENWLLQPLSESNLQLFVLISIWISSKIHNTIPLSVQSLKSLGDVVIMEQHFTTRDFLEAEMVFMQVLDFEIGTSKNTFVFLEELLIQFRALARVGEFVNFEACMDIMDLLYETEETAMLYSSPCPLAAAILARLYTVASYVITVPKQQWEFPLLPWVKFVTSYEERDIGKLVRRILEHILKHPRKEG